MIEIQEIPITTIMCYVMTIYSGTRKKDLYLVIHREKIDMCGRWLLSKNPGMVDSVQYFTYSRVNVSYVRTVS